MDSPFVFVVGIFGFGLVCLLLGTLLDNLRHNFGAEAVNEVMMTLFLIGVYAVLHKLCNLDK